MKKIHFDHILINVVMNVGLFTTFIGIFFFTYVVNVEEDTVKTQISIIITEFMNSIKPFLSQDLTNKILNNIKEPDLSAEDDNIKKQNLNLKNNAIFQILIILIIAMVLGYILCQYYGYNFYYILGNNLIILLLIGLTEFTFLYMVPTKHITGDPNYVMYKLLTKLKSKIE